MLVHFLRMAEGFRSAVAGHSSSEVHFGGLEVLDYSNDFRIEPIVRPRPRTLLRR